MRRRTQLTQTFESSVHEDNKNKFFMDATLYKGIKDNDVSKIIDVSRESGAIEDKDLPDEVQELTLIVTEMRKKYDEVRTETKRLQAQLEKNKKQCDALKQQELQLKQHIANTRKNFQEKTKQEIQMNNVVEARVYDLDIYKQIENRLKHDILIMRKRNYDHDLSLKKDNIKLKTLRQQQFNKTKISYRCKDMLESIEKTVTNKQNERTSKINSIYDVLNRRHDNNRKRQQRQRQIQEVMMRAMSEKLQQQKQCINICFANIFLKKFLKNKMERLISENQVVESAYHKIRSNTDVRDSKQLISRFLNREKDYGQLLQSIAQKQHLLQSLKSQRDTLEHENHSLTEISDQLHEHTFKKGGGYSQLQKKMQLLQSKLQDIKYKKNLMKRWSVRFHCAFASKNREQVLKKYDSKPLQVFLQDVLGEINKYTEHLLGDQNSSQAINQTFISTKPQGQTFHDQMNTRNNRVKTTVQDSTLDDQANYDGLSEADYLQHNRKIIKKNDQNRRFRIKTQNK